MTILNPRLFLVATILAASTQALAAESTVSFDLGAVIKHHAEVGAADGKSNMSFFAEGAGKMLVQGREVRFYAGCNGIDIYSGKKLVDGFADCEFTSIGGGKVYAHFQKVFAANGEWQQRGHFVFSGGSKDLAGVAGSVPVFISVNPPAVGKPVFFVEGGPERDQVSVN